MQPAPNPPTVQDFFHFPFLFAFDDHREWWWDNLPWDRVIGGSM